MGVSIFTKINFAFGFYNLKDLRDKNTVKKAASKSNYCLKHILEKNKYRNILTDEEIAEAIMSRVDSHKTKNKKNKILKSISRRLLAPLLSAEKQRLRNKNNKSKKTNNSTTKVIFAEQRVAGILAKLKTNADCTEHLINEKAKLPQFLYKFAKENNPEADATAKFLLDIGAYREKFEACAKELLKTKICGTLGTEQKDEFFHLGDGDYQYRFRLFVAEIAKKDLILSSLLLTSMDNKYEEQKDYIELYLSDIKGSLLTILAKQVTGRNIKKILDYPFVTVDHVMDLLGEQSVVNFINDNNFQQKALFSHPKVKTAISRYSHDNFLTLKTNYPNADLPKQASYPDNESTDNLSENLLSVGNPPTVLTTAVPVSIVSNDSSLATFIEGAIAELDSMEESISGLTNLTSATGAALIEAQVDAKDKNENLSGLRSTFRREDSKDLLKLDLSSILKDRETQKSPVHTQEDPDEITSDDDSSTLETFSDTESLSDEEQSQDETLSNAESHGSLQETTTSLPEPELAAPVAATPSSDINPLVVATVVDDQDQSHTLTRETSQRHISPYISDKGKNSKKKSKKTNDETPFKHKDFVAKFKKNDVQASAFIKDLSEQAKPANNQLAGAFEIVNHYGARFITNLTNLESIVHLFYKSKDVQDEKLQAERSKLIKKFKKIAAKDFSLIAINLIMLHRSDERFTQSFIELLTDAGRSFDQLLRKEHIKKFGPRLLLAAATNSSIAGQIANPHIFVKINHLIADAGKKASSIDVQSVLFMFIKMGDKFSWIKNEKLVMDWFTKREKLILELAATDTAIANFILSLPCMAQNLVNYAKNMKKAEYVANTLLSLEPLVTNNQTNRECTQIFITLKLGLQAPMENELKSYEHGIKLLKNEKFSWLINTSLIENFIVEHAEKIKPLDAIQIAGISDAIGYVVFTNIPDLSIKNTIATQYRDSPKFASVTLPAIPANELLLASASSGSTSVTPSVAPPPPPPPAMPSAKSQKSHHQLSKKGSSAGLVAAMLSSSSPSAQGAITTDALLRDAISRRQARAQENKTLTIACKLDINTDGFSPNLFYKLVDILVQLATPDFKAERTEEQLIIDLSKLLARVMKRLQTLVIKSNDAFFTTFCNAIRNANPDIDRQQQLDEKMGSIKQEFIEEFKRYAKAQTAMFSGTNDIRDALTKALQNRFKSMNGETANPTQEEDAEAVSTMTFT